MKRLCIILLALLSAFHVRAQFTTEGTDFWFGYMENDHGSREIFLDLYVSSRTDANIRLSNASGSYMVERTVLANTSELIEVPLDFMPIIEGKTNLGLHLVSDEPVSVYALNKGRWTADAAVILPTAVLGQKYYVMAHREPPGDIAPSARGSLALVVSTADNTLVAVTPSVDTDNGWPAGETREISLDQGETYQLRSEFFDLTGTVVEVVDNGNVCANVAVFGGNRFTNVGGCGGNRDHLYEQMMPVNTWGKRFLWVTYETRSGGDFMKVTASEDNTVVRVEGFGNIVLNEGQTETVKALTGPRMIESNKPVQIAQFSRSTECDMVEDSDPFMIMLSPLAQRINQATFDLFIVDQISTYYITLITTPGNDRDITLDGIDISDRFVGVPGANYASFEIERGTHTIVAPEGVIAYVYGYGPSESFGYSAGVSLKNLNVAIEAQDPILGVDALGSEACINSPIEFNAIFEIEPGTDPAFTEFVWDFGDGNTGNGQGVVHAYNEVGTYEITLIASDGTSTCGGTVETVIGTIDVIGVEVDDPGIVGNTSVCPEVEGVVYTVSGDSRNTYEWSVSGGEIVGDNRGTQVAINWGLTNANAYVEVIPISSLGCRGNPLRLDVRINTRLEPDLPIGSQQGCVGDLSNSTYFTPFTPGSLYEWEVEGGEVVSGQGTNQVLINWQTVGTGRVWYREFNPDIADCEGTSDPLEVTVLPGLTAEVTASHVLCFGEATGSINLVPGGGNLGPYTVSWSNGMSGENIEGLTAGLYTATVRDGVGCQLLVDVTIEEPDELLITNAMVENIRCFGEANGVISVDIVGGTPSGTGTYSLQWTSDDYSRTSADEFAAGLTKGTYNLLVTDANGCTATATYTIIEPDLLEADLSTLINDPICPQATNGMAFVDAKGGTPDYQFYWSNNSDTDEQQGSNFAQGTYTLRIVDANGCETQLDVEVNERYPKVYIPNAFSPNGDGHNDEFRVVTDCNLNFNMQVFNEWGGLVFSSNDILNGWDGTVDGEPVPIGKYSYIVFYSGVLNDFSFEETLRGTVRVLR